MKIFLVHVEGLRIFSRGHHDLLNKSGINSLFADVYHALTHAFSFTMASDKPAKKRGTRSDFQGQRADFLVGWLVQYQEASRAKKTGELWRDLFAQYWYNFPWRLPLTEDAPGEIVIDTEGWKAPVKPIETLTPVEEEEKTKIMQATERVIQTRLCECIADCLWARKSKAGLIIDVLGWVSLATHGRRC